MSIPVVFLDLSFQKLLAIEQDTVQMYIDTVSKLFGNFSTWLLLIGD